MKYFILYILPGNQKKQIKHDIVHVGVNMQKMF